MIIHLRAVLAVVAAHKLSLAHMESLWDVVRVQVRLDWP